MAHNHDHGGGEREGGEYVNEGGGQNQVLLPPPATATSSVPLETNRNDANFSVGVEKVKVHFLAAFIHPYTA